MKEDGEGRRVTRPTRCLKAGATEHRAQTDFLGTNHPALVSKLLRYCRVPVEGDN